MINRSTIFRAAHAAARARMAPSKDYRPGDRVDRALGMHVPSFSYRQVFAAALREAYRTARSIALLAAVEASRPVPTPAAAALAADLRRAARASPITRSGNARFNRLNADAAAAIACVIPFPGAGTTV